MIIAIDAAERAYLSVEMKAARDFLEAQLGGNWKAWMAETEAAPAAEQATMEGVTVARRLTAESAINCVSYEYTKRFPLFTRDVNSQKVQGSYHDTFFFAKTFFA